MRQAMPAPKPSKHVGWDEEAVKGASPSLSVTSLADRFKKPQSPPPVKPEAVGDIEFDANLFCSPEEADSRWRKKNVLAFGIFQFASSIGQRAWLTCAI